MEFSSTLILSPENHNKVSLSTQNLKVYKIKSENRIMMLFKKEKLKFH